MASNTNEASKPKVLCKYFQNGVCREGESCSFSHNRTERPNTICKFYLQGSCSYGKGCRFDHNKPDKIARVNHDKSKSLPPTTELLKFLDNPCPSKFVSLNTISTVNKEQSKFSVNAPEFVPGQKYNLRTNTSSTETKETLEGNISYCEATKIGIENFPDEMTEEEANTILCPFAAMGSCRQEDKCLYLHGLQCDICNNYCLDPSDPMQQKEHKLECEKWLEENMKYSFAVQKSEEVSCGICLDKIRLKHDNKDKRFGILPECNHPFCLTCIRKWRSSAQGKNKFVRACPLCRISSGFVIPSDVWVDEPDEKAILIKNYKEAMSTKDCKHFDHGKGTCPFGTSCFYKHARPNGSVENVKVRRYDNSEGESKVINPVRLCQFIEARDNIGLDDL